MLEKPDLYFRLRDRGASVFRVETGNTGRLDLTQIAVIKPNGEVKPFGKAKPTEDEETTITNWISKRNASQQARDAARIDTLIEDINKAAHWLQSEAPDDQIRAKGQSLLMSLHDLRSTIVRRLSRS